jgi:hypothetical protein
VPAAAVKRGGQALFVFIGRKGSVGYILLFRFTNGGFSRILVFSKIICLGLMEGGGTLDGEVKFVDIDGDHQRRRRLPTLN